MRARSEVEALLASVLDRVTVGEAQVSYTREKRIATRFGENAITQNMGGTSETVTVDVVQGSREGSASTNKLDPEALAEAVSRAERIAQHAPENPEHVPLPPPQAYPETPPAFFEVTDRLAPEQLAEDVVAVIQRAKPRGFKASGLFEAASTTIAVANSNGLSGFDRRSYVDYSATLHGPAGSGKVVQNHNDYTRVDAEELAREVAENADRAQNPVDIEPGEYTVIFEPLAVQGLIPFVVFSLSARDADEGTTAFAGTVGTQLVSDKVTLSLRLDDPDLPARRFGTAGLATRPTTWIERGVVRRLFHDRFWAAEQGVEPDAAYFPVFMDGEDQSVDDLVRRCKRGLLVKNLWYIRFVDRRELMLTGMTRDGLFLVEDGEVVAPVKNMRWNESPLVFLRNVVGLSRPERVSGWGWSKLPGVMSEGFTFTSKTESV